jgi:hypothetical protein
MVPEKFIFHNMMNKETLRNRLLSVIALRAMVKNTSQMEELQELRKEIRVKKNSQQNQPGKPKTLLEIANEKLDKLDWPICKEMPIIPQLMMAVFNEESPDRLWSGFN